MGSALRRSKKLQNCLLHCMYMCIHIFFPWEEVWSSYANCRVCDPRRVNDEWVWKLFGGLLHWVKFAISFPWYTAHTSRGMKIPRVFIYQSYFHSPENLWPKGHKWKHNTVVFLFYVNSYFKANAVSPSKCEWCFT